MTHLRRIMLKELERRNYAQTTIDCYIRTVEHFAQYFRCSPDQLGPDHIREYQVALFKEFKLAPNTISQRLAADRPPLALTWLPYCLPPSRKGVGILIHRLFEAQ